MINIFDIEKITTVCLGCGNQHQDLARDENVEIGSTFRSVCCTGRRRIVIAFKSGEFINKIDLEYVFDKQPLVKYPWPKLLDEKME
jgi:hypothetical protein